MNKEELLNFRIPKQMGGQFGASGVYGATKMNWANSGERPHGSRNNDNDRFRNANNRMMFAQQEKAKKRGNGRSADITNEERPKEKRNRPGARTE